MRFVAPSPTPSVATVAQRRMLTRIATPHAHAVHARRHTRRTLTETACHCRRGRRCRRLVHCSVGQTRLRPMPPTHATFGSPAVTVAVPPRHAAGERCHRRLMTRCRCGGGGVACVWSGRSVECVGGAVSWWCCHLWLCCASRPDLDRTPTPAADPCDGVWDSPLSATSRGEGCRCCHS